VVIALYLRINSLEDKISRHMASMSTVPLLTAHQFLTSAPINELISAHQRLQLSQGKK
jgi:hypothetical protein